jgi:hypothetical protein
MDRGQLHETINQMLEAEFDRREMIERLNRFRQTQAPPRKPDQFENLADFLNFYEAKSRYEAERQSLQNRRKKAKKSYNEAERMLRSILPENTPLHYDYEGNRQDLAGQRFTIVNQDRTIMFSSSGPPSR